MENYPKKTLGATQSHNRSEDNKTNWFMSEKRKQKQTGRTSVKEITSEVRPQPTCSKPNDSIK